MKLLTPKDVSFAGRRTTEKMKVSKKLSDAGVANLWFAFAVKADAVMTPAKKMNQYNLRIRLNNLRMRLNS